jgi:hypothetical protein
MVRAATMYLFVGTSLYLGRSLDSAHACMAVGTSEGIVAVFDLASAAAQLPSADERFV